MQFKPVMIMAHELGLFCFNIKYIVSFSINKHQNNCATLTTNTMMDDGVIISVYIYGNIKFLKMG